MKHLKLNKWESPDEVKRICLERLDEISVQGTVNRKLILLAFRIGCTVGKCEVLKKLKNLHV